MKKRGRPKGTTEAAKRRKLKEDEKLKEDAMKADKLLKKQKQIIDNILIDKAFSKNILNKSLTLSKTMIKKKKPKNLQMRDLTLIEDFLSLEARDIFIQFFS